MESNIISSEQLDAHMQDHRREPMKTILSLFDATGNWSAPYRKAGYRVIQRDLQLGHDIFADTIPEVLLMLSEGEEVHGVMAACPCDDFAVSGARWWERKNGEPAKYDSRSVEFSDRVDMYVGMVLATLAIVEWLRPQWWVIENPVGRLERLVPEVGPCRMYFQPCDYGDPYTKKTGLWGNFNPPRPTQPVLPLYGSMIHNMGSHQKKERSITPPGFARAFFNANP